jgi:hypothetical protein
MPVKRTARATLVSACVVGALSVLPTIARGDAPTPAASPTPTPTPTPTVRLRYQRGPGAERCPEESELRNQIAARLGYDPIREQATNEIVAAIEKTPRGLEGRVEIRDEAGKRKGRRVLTSTSLDCTELASALTLAISIAADPLSLGRAPAASVHAPASASVPSPPPPPASASPVAASASVAPVEAAAPASLPAAPAASREDVVPVRPRLLLGVHHAFGAGPARAWGLDFGLGARRGVLSLGLEGRVDWAGAPKPVRSGDGADGTSVGTVEASIFAGSVVPCLHVQRGLLVACALGSVGVIQGRGQGVSVPRKQTTTYAAAGLRLGVEVPVVGPLALGVHGDVLANLTRTTLRLDGVEAWASSPIAGLLRAALLGTF